MNLHIFDFHKDSIIMIKFAHMLRAITLLTMIYFGKCAAHAQDTSSQQLYISSNNGETILMSGNYPIYSYLGTLGPTIVYFAYLDENDWWLYNEYTGLTFPSGNLIENGWEGAEVPAGYYLVTVNLQTGNYSFTLNPEDCSSISESPSASIQITGSETCEPLALRCDVSPTSIGWNYQWIRDGIPVAGANDQYYSAAPLSTDAVEYSCIATCPDNNTNVVSTAISVPACYDDTSSPLNYLLVQNVTTTGNVVGQSVQVQFDLSWGNTWRDDINWDAVWVFLKYKNAQGLWKHCKINPTGYDHGQGTPNIIEPAADQMGAFVRLALEGQGNFNSEGMQLRWNYGAEGLSSVSGLEIRVFATEMVYHPQGDFSMSFGSAAPGGKFPVINNRLTPVISADDNPTIRIKGDAGLDVNADGTIDNTTYPTGYYPFYLFKYEMSEQQYADFLNCLTPEQRTNIGVAGTFITEVDGQYFSSRPNAVCVGSDINRLLAYADWSGLRPMSYLEFQKAYNGPKPPRTFAYYPMDFGACQWWPHPLPDVSDHYSWGSGVYGCKSLTGIVGKIYIHLTAATFNRSVHGNGVLQASGDANEATWAELPWSWADPYNDVTDCNYGLGFRLCRTAE